MPTHDSSNKVLHLMRYVGLQRCKFCQVHEGTQHTILFNFLYFEPSFLHAIVFYFDWSRSLNSWLTKSPWTWMSRMKFARDVSDESCHEPFSHHSSNLKILVKETSWVQSANIVKYAKESNVQFYAFFNNLSRHFYILLYVDISWSVNSRNLRSWELVS